MSPSEEIKMNEAGKAMGEMEARLKDKDDQVSKDLLALLKINQLYHQLLRQLVGRRGQ